MSKHVPSLRRSMGPTANEEDQVAQTVQTATLCRGLQMCERKLSTFIDEYVKILARTIENMFSGILNPYPSDGNKEQSKVHVFDEVLRSNIVKDIRKLLKNADAKISEENESYIWLSVIKKISAKFQFAASHFIAAHLEGDPEDMHNVKKKLTQKLVLATTIIEGKFENKLCVEYKLCEKVHECTKSLNSFLEYFKDLSPDKSREFMKYFYESLPEDTFYFTQRETADEIQIIFSDMTLSHNTATKDILTSVHKIVEDRLRFMESRSELPEAFDTQLIYIILSDLDHFYHNKRRVYPFDTFLARFSEWVRTGGKLTPFIRQVLKEIGSKVSDQHSELRDKLINEIRVFLELTVDK